MAGFDLDRGPPREQKAAQDVDGVYHVEPHFWFSGNVRERQGDDRAPYQEWIAQGFLTAGGDATDPKAIALKIAELNGKYRIETFGL